MTSSAKKKGLPYVLFGDDVHTVDGKKTRTTWDDKNLEKITG